MSPEDLSREVWTTLKALRACGLKLAVGSSSKNAKLILKKISLEKFFYGDSDALRQNHMAFDLFWGIGVVVWEKEARKLKKEQRRQQEQDYYKRMFSMEDCKRGIKSEDGICGPEYIQ